ncbi:uncharacterized protein LOC135205018 [Macrobrachium nipponense]|uniref:uncharacterized protein LOC135205018 n=1 Tax=Macrobrachium nipponense TaxID=159736 RepID=UPI0030C7DA17
MSHRLPKAESAVAPPDTNTDSPSNVPGASGVIQTAASLATSREADASTGDDVEDLIQPAAATIFSDAPPGPLPEDEVSREDENLLKYFIMLRPKGPTATTLAKVCTALYSGEGQSVKDYCSHVLGFSNTQYRKIFTLHERNTLEAGTDWQTFDITFLYKLLQWVCGLAPTSDKKWTEPTATGVNEELEHMLYRIKCERNFLAHEAVTLSDEELQERSSKLKTLLENILCKVSQRKNIDLSQDVKTARVKLDEILNSTSKYSLKSYQKELEDLRQDIVNKLVVNSQAELFPHYLDLWSSALVQWFQVPTAEGNNDLRESEIFTNVTIKDMNNSVMSVEDILSHRIENSTPPRVMIIEGIAGIGKSHVCKYILHKWASVKGEDINLPDVEIIIFIQCHTVNSKSLREYLTEELLPNTCSTIRQEDVIPALQKCCVLFVVDGLDEAGSNVRAIVRELTTKFPKNRKIITCRPEFTEDAKTLMSSNSKDTCIFFAKGFDSNQRREYLGKLLATVKVNISDYESTLNRLYERIQELEHHLYALLCMPLTMMMLVSLWLDDDVSLSQTTTVTRIHQEITEMKIKQLAQRTQRRLGESRHISLVERTCQKWLKALSKAAWETLRHNTQVLDEKRADELVQEAESNNIDPMDALSCFMKCITLQKKFRTQYAWEFFHKSFQEYLTAVYVSQNQDILGMPRHDILHINYTQPQKPIRSAALPTAVEENALSWQRKKKAKQRGAFCMEALLSCVTNCCRYKYHHRAPYAEEYYSYSLKKRGFSKDGSFVNEGRVEWPSPCAEGHHQDFIQEGKEGGAGHDDESPYSFEIDAEKVDKQNTLQFLAAMETSKDDINLEYLRKIVREYRQATSTTAWVQWATFLRECHEHPAVCKLLREVFEWNVIEFFSPNSYDTEVFEAVDFLLRKTKFSPHKCKLWFNREESLPDGLGQMLSTMMEVSPTTPVSIMCNFALSADMEQCLGQLVKTDTITLTFNGKLQDKNTSDLISLLKCSQEKDADIQLSVMIESTEDLRNFAHCCTASPIPRSAKLDLWVYCASAEMLGPLSEVFKAYGWQKPLSVGFQDAEMSELTKDIQELLRGALHKSSVKLTKMELMVEAYAENRLKDYEEMACGIADDTPCGVVFEGAADGDDIILVLDGIPQG